jgi:catabolite repression HPr-like protein
MVKETVEVHIPEQAEIRPVAMLVQLASRFTSSLHIESGTKSFNAKSIMGMMTLGLYAGETITVSADGEDEEQALQTLTGYLTGHVEA